MQSNPVFYSPSPWPNGSIVGVYVGLGIVFAMLLVRVLTPKPDTTAAFIHEHPIVLLPTLLTMNAFWLMNHVPWLTAATPTYHLLDLTVRLSTGFMIVIIATPLAVWATVCLTHTWADARLPAPAMAQVWRFVAASLLVTVGMCVLLIAVLPMLQRAGVIVLIFMGAVWLVFNLLSCTWYAAMMTDHPTLWASLLEAARFGLRRWRPPLRRVFLPLLFSGFFVYYSVETHHFTPPPLPAPPVLPTNAGNSSSFGSGFGGNWSGINESSGWSIQLLWVLSGQDANQWLEKTAAQADETPWPISRYIVETLTVLVATYFIVSYSLIYLRMPITAKTDKRTGFEVVMSPTVNADNSMS